MSEAVSVTSFLSLPPEICIQILAQLDWKELLVNQRVCKRIQAIIQSSQIQYRITLGITGYEDGPESHPMPILERDKTLRALQSRFTRLEFPTETAIELRGYTPTYELQGGVFLQGISPHVNWDETVGVNAWSFHTVNAPYHWQLPDFDQPIRDLTLDPSQDLLILIEGGRSDQPLFLRFLSLTTGEKHPLVTEDLTCPTLSKSVRLGGFLVTISGELVGLLAMEVWFFICNWKTGKILVNLDFHSAHQVDDFFFLDRERFVLIRTTGHDPAVLEVYRLPIDNAQPFEPFSIAVYQLPVLTPGTILEPISARSDPPPRSNYSTYKSSPIFTTSPYSVRSEDRIIILTLEMQNEQGERTLNLVVRAETFMNIPDDTPRELGGIAIVPPEKWMRQTRLLPGVIPPHQWMCYCYGSRMVIPSEGLVGEVSQPKWRVQPRVLDFNPSLVAWVDAGKEGTPWDPDGPPMEKGSNALFLSRVGKKDKFLAEEWESGLPFTLVASYCFDMPTSERMVLMMDDRRLLTVQMVQAAASGREPRCLRIYE